MSLKIPPDERQLQDLMDKMINEVYSQLGISERKAESAVKAEINSYDAYMQKKLKEEK